MSLKTPARIVSVEVIVYWTDNAVVVIYISLFDGSSVHDEI